MGRDTRYLINWYSEWKEYTGEPERFIDAGDWIVVEINEDHLTLSRALHALGLEGETLDAVGLSEQDVHADS
jgi:hypothetical protein